MRTRYPSRSVARRVASSAQRKWAWCRGRDLKGQTGRGFAPRLCDGDSDEEFRPGSVVAGGFLAAKRRPLDALALTSTSVAAAQRSGVGRTILLRPSAGSVVGSPAPAIRRPKGLGHRTARLKPAELRRDFQKCLQIVAEDVFHPLPWLAWQPTIFDFRGERPA